MKKEKLVRNILIGLTLFNLILNYLLEPDLVYQGYGYVKRDFYTSFCNSEILLVILWIVSILTGIFAISYIIFALKSKKERLLKVTFATISVLYTPLVLALVMNLLTKIFYIKLF